MTVTENHETNDSLLVRVRDPQDREAWEEIVAIYRPMICRVAKRRGLQDADAQNVAQVVLQKVATAVQGWERKPAGGFRRWLATVARNAAIDWLRKVQLDAPQGGSTAQLQVRVIAESTSDLESEIRREVEREAFRWAARRIRGEFAETTWLAFWQTMVEGNSSTEVAEALGKSVGAIYTSRSRVMRRLKVEVESFQWPSE